MKKLIKMSGYILATVMVLLVSQFSAFAANDSSVKSLSGMQVFGGFAVLVLVILLPLLKRENKRKVI